MSLGTSSPRPTAPCGFCTTRLGVSINARKRNHDIYAQRNLDWYSLLRVEPEVFAAAGHQEPGNDEETGNPFMRSKPWLRTVAIVFVLALVAAACGDDDSAATTTSAPAATTTTSAPAAATTTSAPAATTTTAAAATTTTAAAVEPIILYSIIDENEALGQFFPEVRAALAAAELFVNDNNGLGGSGTPVEIRICVGEVDPNVNADCGREVVGGDAIAAVGSAICTNDTAYPILNEATPPVPNVGPLTCLPSTFGSPNTFSVNAGIQGAVVVEAAVACKALGAETVYVNLVAVDSILATSPLYDGMLQAMGCSPKAKQIEMARDQFDAVPAVAQYGGADVVLHLLAPPQPGPVINAAAQQGTDAVLVFTPTNMSSVILENTAGNNEGVMTARWYRAPDSGVAGYDDYSDYLGRVDGLEFIADEFGTAAWVSVLALDQAYRDCAGCEFTREGALAALNGLSGFDAGGMAPVIDFTQPAAHPLAERFPRIFTTKGFAGIVENGVIVTFGDGEALGI